MDARSHDPQHFLGSFTRPVSLVDPLAAARGRPDFCGYWENPSRGEAIACFGVMATLDRAPRDADSRCAGPKVGSVHPAPVEGQVVAPGPWFGGVAFDVHSRAQWRGFPAVRWVLPRELVWTRAGRSYVTHFFDAEDSSPAAAEQALNQWVESLPRHAYRPQPVSRDLETHSFRKEWDRLIEQSLHAIHAGALSKVVAARAIEVAAKADLDPLELLASLRSYAPSCTTFLFAAEDGRSVFVGATPETFCRIQDRQLEAEALAGTAVPGDNNAWNERDKERREHGAVTDAILQGLAPLVEVLHVDPASVISLPNVRHMRTPIRATLRSQVDAGDVIQALHPTPAVGGTPRDRALSFLKEHENLDRGWYAGVVGWIGNGQADLRVALRSALIEGPRARVFVGAGIVAGSDAEAEWLETEAKSVPMLQALGGGDAGRQR